MTITTDVNSTGLQPTPPTTLQQELISLVAASNPGYTANLPGSLIEDISSTDVGALALIDSARVELFNSITPYTANSFILNQLGQIYGVQQGVGSNTSVYVTFLGSPGFVIPVGFIVSDGNHQYTVQDGGIIPTSGQSVALYCLANTAGSWAVPTGTVTQIVTSVPAGVTLTCTNQTAGLPGATAQPLEDYQAQVIQAGLAVAQGMPTFLKTQLQNVPGVQARLCAVRQQGSYWEVICGGGDPYQVGNAIFTGLFDIANLVGSTMGVAGITNAYPAVVTTTLNHGFATGQVVQITGETGMSNVNGNNFVAIVLSENTFSLNCQISSMTWATGVVTVTTASPHGLPTGTSSGTIYGVTPTAYNGSYTFTRTGANTFTYPLVTNPGTVTVQGYTGFDSVSQGTWTTGGVVTPNLRNVTVSINDYPDSYNITFVNPPVQTVNISLVWNTTSTNYVSPTAVAQLGQPAIVNYINSIYVGQPINLFELQNVFQIAIAGIIPPTLLSRMVFTVEINGYEVSPESGTGLYYGDPESYFETSNAQVVITQG